jgi:hypothetical protein
MHGTNIRPIDVALMLRRPWLNRWLARIPILRQFVCVIKIFLIGRQSLALTNTSLTHPSSTEPTFLTTDNEALPTLKDFVAYQDPSPIELAPGHCGARYHPKCLGHRGFQ